MSVPSMALPLWPSALPGICVRPTRALTGPAAIPLPMPGPKTGPAPAGRIRRSHNDAHNHHGDGPQREVDGRLLRHLGHSRFRVSLGLHGVLALADTDSILTRSNRLGNTDYPAQRHG